MAKRSPGTSARGRRSEEPTTAATSEEPRHLGGHGGVGFAPHHGPPLEWSSLGMSGLRQETLLHDLLPSQRLFDPGVRDSLVLDRVHERLEGRRLLIGAPAA